MKKYHICPIICAIVLVLTACSDESAFSSAFMADVEEPVCSTTFAMDTYVVITAYGADAQKAADNCTETIETYDRLWNVNSPESDVGRINAGGGKTDVYFETADLIRFSREIGERTDGALDITLYPVLREWGFTTGEYKVPDEERLCELLALTGYDKLAVDGNTVSVDSNSMIDLGAVAKGRVGDLAAEAVEISGVTSAIIDIGGNVRAVGTKPDGSDWCVALKDPKGDGHLGTLDVSDCSVVTSGVYERFFECDGKIYGHILDPKTGKPADSGIISATVVGSDGRLCDALSTAFYVMGEERSEKFYRENEGFEMILVTDDGRVILGEGLKDRFTAYEGCGEIEVVSRENG